MTAKQTRRQFYGQLYGALKRRTNQMIGIVYNRAWQPSALPNQCAYRWYREADQTVIVILEPVPPRKPGRMKEKTLGELFPELFK